MYIEVNYKDKENEKNSVVAADFMQADGLVKEFIQKGYTDITVVVIVREECGSIPDCFVQEKKIDGKIRYSYKVS